MNSCTRSSPPGSSARAALPMIARHDRRALAVQDVRQPRDVEAAGELVLGEVAPREGDPVSDAGRADDALGERFRRRQIEDRRVQAGVGERELDGPRAGAAAEVQQAAASAEIDLPRRPRRRPEGVAVHAHQEVLDLRGVPVAGAAAHRSAGERRLVKPVPGGDEVGVVADHEPDVVRRSPHEVGQGRRGVREACVRFVQKPERGQRFEERRHAALVAPDPLRDLRPVEARVADDGEDVEPDAGVQREALPVRAGHTEDLPRALSIRFRSSMTGRFFIVRGRVSTSGEGRHVREVLAGLLERNSPQLLTGAWGATLSGSRRRRGRPHLVKAGRSTASIWISGGPARASGPGRIRPDGILLKHSLNDLYWKMHQE